MENGLGYLIIKQDARPYPPPPDGEPGSGPEHLLPGGEGPRRRARPPARVPPAVGREHQRHELRRAVGAGGRGAEPRRRARRRACRTPARAVSPSTTATAASSIFQIGTGYFGCRDARRALRPRRAAGDDRARPGARARDQALAGRQARASAAWCPRRKMTPEIAAIRGVEAGQGLPQPAEPLGVHDRRRADRVLRAGRRRRPGLPVGIKSAVGEQPFWQELADAHGGDRRRAGLHHRRRRRGRHGRGAAVVRRPRRAAVQDRRSPASTRRSPHAG